MKMGFYLLLAIFLFLCNSCALYDVSNDVSLIGGYKVGETYVSQKNMLIANEGWLTGNDITIERYSKNLESGGYKGILKKDELVIIIRILYKFHIENGDSIHPIGRVLSGPLKGEEVDLDLVSKIISRKQVDGRWINILTNDDNFFSKYRKTGEK